MQGNAVCFAWEKEYNERKDWGMFLSKAGAKAALPDLTGTCAQQRVENDACPTEPWRRQCYRMRLFVSLKLSCSRNGKRCPSAWKRRGKDAGAMLPVSLGART